MSFHRQVSLDFPVSLGGYRHPRDPAEPMVLHLVHVPGAPNQGLDARAQFRIGQGKLYAMTFADFEARIRDELDRMLGPGGFSSARDIAAITVNRWPHGYGYVANSLLRSGRLRRHRAQARAADGPAASRSPIPTPAATPRRILRSTRPRGRWRSCWADAAKTSFFLLEREQPARHRIREHPNA